MLRKKITYVFPKLPWPWNVNKSQQNLNKSVKLSEDYYRAKFERFNINSLLEKVHMLQLRPILKCVDDVF